MGTGKCGGWRRSRDRDSNTEISGKGPERGRTEINAIFTLDPVQRQNIKSGGPRSHTCRESSGCWWLLGYPAPWALVVGCGAVMVLLGPGRPGKPPQPSGYTNANSQQSPQDTFAVSFHPSSSAQKQLGIYSHLCTQCLLLTVQIISAEKRFVFFPAETM